MATKIYKTEERLVGPWLLDSEALKKLDGIIEDEARRMEGAKKLKFERALRRERYRLKRQSWFVGLSPEEKKEHLKRVRRDVGSLPFREDKRAVTIGLRSGHKIAVSRFADALLHPDIQNETPNEFELHLSIGESEINVALGGLWRNGQLQIEVSPSSSRESHEAFVKLRRWAENYKPTKWIAVWNFLSDSFGVVAIMAIGAVAIAHLIAVFIYQLQRGDPKAHLKAKAGELLKIGVNQANERQATELILALLSDQDLQPQTPPIPEWNWYFSASVVVALVIVWFAPPSVLGIGNGDASINRWKGWAKFLGWTAPFWVFGSFIVPIVRDYLRHFLGM